MILADKIIDERNKLGFSQEELADKLNVSRQSVSKWESAQSTPDLQRIIEMAKIFNVSTDYLLKDEMEIVEEGQQVVDTPKRVVSLDFANEYLDGQKKGSKLISDAISLFIISPVLLIVLAGLADSNIGGISEKMAVGIGMVTLFLLVVVGVFTVVSYGIKNSKFEFLEKEGFETLYGVTGLAKELKERHESTFVKGLSIGICLCIIAALPLIIGGIVEAPDYVLCALTGLLLIIVAIGVNLIIRVSMIRSSFDVLLQTGEYSKKEKNFNEKAKVANSIYWLSATAIYLGWSFYTNDWHFTWIVWPVAGVLSALFHMILRLIVKDK